MQKDVDINVLATNDCITDGGEVKGFERLEAQLQRVRQLHIQGASKNEIKDAVNEIVMDTIVDPLGDSVDGELYNWRSPLGHLVDAACRRIMRAHGLSSNQHMRRREEVMQTVCKWIVDPNVIFKTNPDTKMTTWLSARISWNGYEAGCKDVSDIYGIHVANVPQYDKNTHKKLGMMDIHTTDRSDIEMRDGEESSIFDRVEGTSLISKNPENIVVGDDSDDAMLLDVVAEGIAEAVRSFCKNYQYNYNDLERYCVDYDSCKSGDLPSVKKYGDAPRIFRQMSLGNFYKKKILDLINNELIIKNIPLELAEYLVNLPWNTPRRDTHPGLRDVICAAVTVAAHHCDGVIS